jgi:hypothetical protein
MGVRACLFAAEAVKLPEIQRHARNFSLEAKEPGENAAPLRIAYGGNPFGVANWPLYSVQSLS